MLALMAAIILCLFSACTIPISLVTVGMLSFLYWSTTARDPYGLFHLSLNKLPGEDIDSSPKTEWLNMGFWKDTNVFPEACQALCCKLIRAAQCKNGDRILDVGHGTGDSLIVLLSQPVGQRPSAVTGITSLPVHHDRSRARIDRLLSSLSNPPPRVDLYLGDAVCQHSKAAHPLDSSSLTSFDRILALDCAYHFNTRLDFLRQSYLKLVPGGRIALADICFDAQMLQSRRLWFLSSVFKLMPRHNMISAEEYVAQLRDIGYVDVNLEDITEEVFPGFVRFLKSRGIGWKMFASIIEWYSKAGTRFVIVSGCRHQCLSA
ncbi:hypothetical protein J132_09867 [Termitomyces sp. J132]|nr:hypothetical protein J132_09867 [Termitomyces sp. J132]